MYVYGIFGFIFVWLLLLSWVVFSTRKHYHNLVSKTKKQKIDDILDKLLEDITEKEKTIKIIHQEIKKLKEESYNYIQKVGIVRFNPFKQMGGEQSFVLSFLDKNNNGLVVNFIYTREGMRIYSKEVEFGKGKKYPLSNEEKKAVRNGI